MRVCGLLLFLPLVTFGKGQLQPLFDGKTLAGWSDKTGGQPGSGWVAEGGCIVRKEKSGDLYSKRSFKNFEFFFEWKIVAGCNSGVKYRVTDYSGSILGPEYQIIDDEKLKYAPDHLGATASIYAIKGAALEKKLNPPDSFNKSRIVAHGKRIEHWLNGEKVAEIKIDSDDWKKRHAASKFKKRPNFGTKKGRLMLQDHGGKVWYRNLIIREL
ncbi:MAG: hypothetical protein CMI31_13515 [Opitutae bacterium]|nr:hypothetical protein [Opitutae bacterium]|tara:strand:+ start:1175 stop:1813 length:639 start_codon:yes stop_codon:yes gene_type:complete